MDPLTHCLLGGMAAKTVGGSRRRFWIMMFLGAAPDLDVLANGLGSWAFALQHRGITHSIIGVVLQSLFYAWAFSRFDKGIFHRRTLHYSIPIALHVLCDYLTSFGVPLLAPFSFRSFSADLMMDLCIVPTICMSIGLFWLHRHELDGWGVTRPLWGIWVVYILVAATGKAYAVKLAEAPQRQVTALPTGYSPFNWRAISLDGATHTYRQDSIDLLKGESIGTQSFPMPKDEFPVQASLRSPEVQLFLKTNRWPIVRVAKAPDGWSVDWGNLLFSRRGLVRGKVHVEVSPRGAVLHEENIFTFWNPDHC